MIPDLTTIVLIASNTFLFLSNVFILLSLTQLGIPDNIYQNSIDVFLGLGSSLSLINLLTIMSSFEILEPVSISIKTTIQYVSLLIAGVLPVYFAFLFAGYMAFHEHEKFDSLRKTNATLNAILAGDEIMPFIMALLEAYGTLGFLYSMSFCVLFVICIHNVFIYIVSESFKNQSFKFEKEETKKIATHKIHPSFSRQKTMALDAHIHTLYENSAISRSLETHKPVLDSNQNLDQL